MREVSPPKAIGLGVAVTVALLGLARAESPTVVNSLPRAAAAVLGGAPERPPRPGAARRARRVGGLGWLAVSAASRRLQQAGAAAWRPPTRRSRTSPEVTGSPASGIPWARPVPGGPSLAEHGPAPGAHRRGHGGAGHAADPGLRLAGRAPPEEARAELLLREIDRTRALERNVSPCSPPPAPAT